MRRAIKREAFSLTKGTSGFQVSHTAWVIASNNLEMGLVCQRLYLTNEKIALFQIVSKLRCTLTDNGFKQAKITNLAVISNLDKLVQHSYMLSMEMRTLAWQCLSLWPQSANFNFCINKRWRVHVEVFIQDFELWGGRRRGKQDGSRIIVACETRACLLGGSGGMPP